MKPSVEYNSVIPLYAQIVEYLRKDIAANTFGRNGKIPTEAELSEKYGVSRITVRRAVDERAERFLNRFAGHHWIVDAKELGLDQIDSHVAEYFNASLMHPISKQMIAAMGDVRMHPMTYRRYMWKFEY